MHLPYYIMIILLTGTAYNTLCASDTDWDFFDTIEFPRASRQPSTPPDERGRLLGLPISSLSIDVVENDVSSSPSFESLSKRPRTTIEVSSAQQEARFLQTIELLKKELTSSKTKISILSKKVKSLELLNKELDSNKKRISELGKKVKSLARRKTAASYERRIASLEKKSGYHDRAIQQLRAFNAPRFLESSTRVWQQLSASLDQLETPVALKMIDDFIATLPPSIDTNSPIMHQIFQTQSKYAYRQFEESLEDHDRAQTALEKEQFIEEAITFFKLRYQSR